MTDNKNISVKKQLLVNKLLQDSQMGSKVVFDNVVVKNGKVVLVNETKSGHAKLSAQQIRFFEKNQSVTFVGNKAERLGIKGTKINASSTKTKVSHVNVEEL